MRRALPAVLANIPAQETVDAALRALVAPETDQLLDDRLLKALGKLRARHAGLVFDAGAVAAIMEREVEAAGRYAAAAAGLVTEPGGGNGRGAGSGADAGGLLRRALADALADRRETVFRCLGLLHDPDRVYRCFLAVQGGERMLRDSALEWLEQTLGHASFSALAPLLEPLPAAPPAPGTLQLALVRLERDNDSWLAHCAGQLRLQPQRAARSPALPSAPDDMELIEKVLLLQRVDLLQGARSTHLALLGSIAEVVEARQGEVLIRRDEPPQCLYVVVRGGVELEASPGSLIEGGPGTAFGTWALIDDSPSRVEARVVDDARLLRISRRDFHELLSEHSELAVGLLQGLARRLHALAGV